MQLIFVSEIARRKVHRHGMLNTCKPRDSAGFGRREMPLRGGQPPIFLQEARFDKQLARAVRKRNDTREICLVEREIGRIGNPLSGTGSQGSGTEEFSDRDMPIRGRGECRFRISSAPDRTLGFVQPRSDRQTQRFQLWLLHIDPNLFLKRECKAWNAVVEHRCFDTEIGIIEQDISLSWG